MPQTPHPRVPAFTATRRFAPLLALILTLAACAPAPRETFDLGSGAPVENLRRIGQEIAVAEPAASTLLDSDRMSIRGVNGDLAYLADAQWSDRLPRLVQARLIAKLGAAGVNAVHSGAPARSELTSELRRFEIDLARASAVVEISVRVADAATGATRARTMVVGEAPAPHTRPSEAARALRAALDQALDRLVAWTRGDTASQ